MDKRIIKYQKGDLMPKRRGRLFVISGPSGAGKGTIVKRIMEDRGPVRTALSVSATTRAPREGEIDGKSYFFLSEEEFLRRVEDGGFLEYAEVYGNYYGTPRPYVEDRLSNGFDVILEIDIQGAMNVKKSFPGGVFIFLIPPSMDVLRGRLRARGTDSDEAVELRLSEVRKELAHVSDYDYCVVNNDLDEAVAETEAIFTAEHARVDDDIRKLIKENYEEGDKDAQ